MFADRAKIYIRSGKGGDGHVSFRRELYVAAGGPDGGDGGRGGDVIFVVDEGMNTLTDYRHRTKYKAGDGSPGNKKRQHGADGEDLILKVPEGTVLKDAATGLIVADMSGENNRVTVLKGGKGGLGNMHFATSTMQVPKYAQPGQPSKELELLMELKLIADVGLCGFPNAGKSTFLSVVSNARPEIANYPFTTLTPHLGVVDYKGIDGFVIADIPGLIEGASEGVGLGHDFLRHIERTKVLINIVDAAGTEGRDPVEDVRIIREELASYNEELPDRPCVIAANKMDVLDDKAREEALERLREAYPDDTVVAISAVSGEGIDKLMYIVKDILAELPEETTVFESEFTYETPDENLPYTVEFKNGEYVVEGPKIDKMLGYTNIDSEKGFEFFQNFLKSEGILDELERLGIQDGDTVRMYGLTFDYYK
ncbi:MAG: GTPase ObgE [Lachnospiraceae bacterium]|nr:GTPase ObgE [Lachnospiraceae bacterium]